MGDIRIGTDHIYINGKPDKIMSGAMHYFRIVPQYWKDRLLKLKELGCNCVETYLCWNLHEKREGEFDFSGWLDFGAFLEEAKELGLYAIVRPGPYICSEWDFGGMPWWLLKDQNIQLRCSDPGFLQKITPYLQEVCSLLKPHLISNGGNVILVQIENEYGSYGNDQDYLRWLKAFYEDNGIDCPLITSDGYSEFLLKNGALPEVFASVNYRWNSVRSLNCLKQYHPGHPGAVLELWNGKAKHWGEPYVPRDLEEVKDSVAKALDHGELVNLYMFHGGTTFGFMNGALDKGKWLVQTTSYDCEAPLNEYGFRTEKYYAEQTIICEKLGIPVRNTASDPVFREYPDVRCVGQTTLTENPQLLRKTVSSPMKTMEQCDQGYGYIIYRTKIFVGCDGARLILPEVRDIAHVYVDGTYAATFDRTDSQREIAVTRQGQVEISVLVENMGRINYGMLLKDPKGLMGELVVYDGEYGLYAKTFGYEIYSLELETLPERYDTAVQMNAPAMYCYEVDIDSRADTLLRLEGFTRGVAFLNGFNLGRHWTIEHSENKLYIPAPLLKEGINRIVVFDVLANDGPKTVKLAKE